MIKTFIYGSPKGFDFYENDAAYKEYFLSFYITSRRGRRLMVYRKRKSDGVTFETLYNYLHYGLREAEVRPNSFLGMTIVMDNNEYCQDFLSMLNWFDLLFKNVIERGELLKRNDNGNIQYVVRQFDDRSVAFLKENLGNIFQKVSTSHYSDDTFTDSTQVGLVPALNDKQSNRFYLDYFKKNNSIIISDEFNHIQESTPDTPFSPTTPITPSSFELDYYELKLQLDECNKKLVPIATAIATGSGKVSWKKLVSMREAVSSSLETIDNYIDTVKGKIQLFSKLAKDYQTLLNSIVALLQNKGSSDPAPDDPSITRQCSVCGQTKDVSLFASPSSKMCLECEAKMPPYHPSKRCVKCMQDKPVEDFIGRSNICRECQEEYKKQSKKCCRCGRTRPSTDFPNNGNICKDCINTFDWRKTLNNIIHKVTHIAPVVLAFLVIIGSAIFVVDKLFGRCGVEKPVTEAVEDTLSNENEQKVETDSAATHTSDNQTTEGNETPESQSAKLPKDKAKTGSDSVITKPAETIKTDTITIRYIKNGEETEYIYPNRNKNKYLAADMNTTVKVTYNNGNYSYIIEGEKEKRKGEREVKLAESGKKYVFYFGKKNDIQITVETRNQEQ